MKKVFLRRNEIRERLIREKVVYVRKLATLFNVSKRTIRNDIHYFESIGLCETFYGGARHILIDNTSRCNESMKVVESDKLRNKIETVFKKGVFILGSFNIDAFMAIDCFPVIGESIFCKSISYFFGGKGLNQAIAASKFNNHVHLTIKIGCDYSCKEIESFINNKNIRSYSIHIDKKNKTGMSTILYKENTGDNIILVNSGANKNLKINELKQDFFMSGERGVFLTQLENNIRVTGYGLKLARENNCLTILNPSPYTDGVFMYMKYVDILICNAIDAEKVSGISVTNRVSAENAAHKILKLGIKKVIITLDSEGCLLFDGVNSVHIKGNKAAVVDCCGAGDAFIGAFAGVLANGYEFINAAKIATLFSSLKVEYLGASSMPEASLIHSRLEI
ncbi:DeoR family transcriptional regulator [Salmonella enterica subsp. enterica]|nr:DeoR family transcriptional regulator [Salmonella enterica subsp. enterica]